MEIEVDWYQLKELQKQNTELIGFCMSPICFGKTITLKVVRKKKKVHEKFEGFTRMFPFFTVMKNLVIGFFNVEMPW